ncbi:MAG: hypothetical protein WC980_06200 [Candidatus Brocadiia bacterium]
MPIKSKVEIPVAPVVTPHPDMSQKWEQNSKSGAQTANARRKWRIKNDGDYGQLVATVAADKYKERVKFSSAGGSDRDENDIYTMHRRKLLKSYNKYSKGLDFAYAEDGKRFKEAIENKKGNWEEAIGGTLRFTGSRARGKQVVSVVGDWLTGEQYVVGALPEGAQILGGGPYDIAPSRLKATFRASLTQLLTQTGILISESEHNPASMLKHNSRIKDFLSRMSDPARAANWSIDRLPDKSYCVWFLKEGQLHLGIQVYSE